MAVLASCSAGDDSPPEADDATGTAPGVTTTVATAPPDDPVELFPDVVGGDAERSDDGTWTIRATLSSPYDTPERYADAWRVLGPDGAVLGVRELAHDHANEQPFTRSLAGVAIPDDVDVITLEGRDQVSGWGGATFTIDLDR